MPLERSAIVAAALDVLDETGLEGLTMRRLAEALDVQAPSLYWHFASKPALLDAMANALLDRVARNPDGAADFSTVLRRSADELRVALQARRDGARVYAGASVVGENALRLAQTMFAALMEGGHDPRTSMRAGLALIYYVLGFVSQEQLWQRQAGLDQAALTAQLAMWNGRFPAVEAALPHLSAGDADGRFAFGVELILNGLVARKPGEADHIEAFVRALQAVR